jgi:glutathione synthase/RimK-type ligase-like ATP-grasp enzyme
MNKRILILTELGDVHAYAVCEALRCKGADPILWHTSDFPSRSIESISIEGYSLRIDVRGPNLQLFDVEIDAVWHRRPSYVIPEDRLHPADRPVANQECSVFRRSLFKLLAPKAFWVNPVDSAIAAGRKPVQQWLATTVGFKTPASLYSNDPSEIRAFLARHGGQAVCKPFRSATWQDESTTYMCYTALLTEDRLVVSDELLQAVPGVYQELVPKAYELRVTLIGERAFAAKILSQQSETGKLDWRKAYHELEMQPYDLPDSVAAACRALLSRMGLVFGCFDLVVTPEGEYVFLEVNEMGQFLFVEHYSGLPLLDAFTDFLIRGELEPGWEPKAGGVRYSEVYETAAAMENELSAMHVTPIGQHIWEGKSGGT